MTATRKVIDNDLAAIIAEHLIKVNLETLLIDNRLRVNSRVCDSLQDVVYAVLIANALD